MCVYVMHTCHSTHIQIRGQLLKASSLLLPCVFQGTWWQAPLPTEPFRHPDFYILATTLKEPFPALKVSTTWMPFPALFRPIRKARRRWACQSNIARLCLVKRKIHGGRFWSVRCVTQARQWAEIRNRVFMELNVACWKWSQRSSAVSLGMLKMTDERRGLPGINILCTAYSEPTTFWNRTAILPASQVYIVNIVDHILDNTRDSTTHFTLKSEFSDTGPVSGEGKALLMVIHYHLLIKGCTK